MASPVTQTSTFSWRRSTDDKVDGERNIWIYNTYVGAIAIIEPIKPRPFPKPKPQEY